MLNMNELDDIDFIMNQKKLAQALNLCTNTLRKYEEMGLIHRLNLPGAKYSLKQVKAALINENEKTDNPRHKKENV